MTPQEKEIKEAELKFRHLLALKDIYEPHRSGVVYLRDYPNTFWDIVFPQVYRLGYFRKG